MKSVGGFYYVRCDGEMYECKARGSFRKRGSSPVAGDRVRITVPDDGFLDVVVVPKVSNWTVFKNFKKIFSGDHIHTIKSIKTCKTDHLEVSSTDLLRGEVEGELLITGNYRVEVIPGALNVLTNLP